jgi:NADH:ubiquinone oxidoreductase subunit 2 (subunit N)
VATRVVVPVTTGVVIAVCVVFTVAFGIVPGPFIHLAEHASLLF